MKIAVGSTSVRMLFPLANGSGIIAGVDISTVRVVEWTAGSSIDAWVPTEADDWTDPYTQGEIKECPTTAGWYRVDVPNSWFGSARSMVVALHAPGAVPQLVEIDVVSLNGSGIESVYIDNANLPSPLECDLTSVLGTAIPETNAGSVATNLAHFFDVASPIDFTVQNLSNAIDNAHPDNLEIETGITMTEALKAIAAATAGVSADDGNTFQAIGNDATTRITASVDGDGNRTSVNLSL